MNLAWAVVIKQSSETVFQHDLISKASTAFGSSDIVGYSPYYKPLSMVVTPKKPYKTLYKPCKTLCKPYKTLKKQYKIL